MNAFENLKMEIANLERLTVNIPKQIAGLKKTLAEKQAELNEKRAILAQLTGKPIPSAAQEATALTEEVPQKPKFPSWAMPVVQPPPANNAAAQFAKEAKLMFGED